MIKKLEPLQGLDHSWLNKINELVEFCNDIGNARLFLENHNKQIEKLENKLSILEEQIHPTAKVDPYEKERKWIGKLCKFWDDESEGYIYDILIDIEDDGSGYPYKITDVDSKSWTMSYKYCEPVPEDLIYKGE